MMRNITLKNINEIDTCYYSKFQAHLDEIKREGRYRKFVEIERDASRFPIAFCPQIGCDVTLWCSNDYLGLGTNAEVIKQASQVLQKCGIGAGGTRNISGNNSALVKLEQTLAKLHNRQQALVFTSGYVANQNAIFALSKILHNLVVFSDSQNHASIIAGISYSKVEKHIFAHNDLTSLEQALQQVDISANKLIIFESVYSMDGSVAPIAQITQLARKYNALTYVDEVHAVGLYGEKGAGLIEQLGLNEHIDIIQATLGKSFGGMGGYIAAKHEIIEAIRLVSPGFIFTTAIPPALAAGLDASVNISMQSQELRKTHQAKVKLLKDSLSRANIKFMQNDSHIIPVIIGDPAVAMQISQKLLHEYKIYVQHINYPTVAKGTERLRVIVTPYHSDEMIENFTWALKHVLHN